LGPKASAFPKLRLMALAECGGHAILGRCSGRPALVTCFRTSPTSLPYGCLALTPMRSEGLAHSSTHAIIALLLLIDLRGTRVDEEHSG